MGPPGRARHAHEGDPRPGSPRLGRGLALRVAAVGDLHARVGHEERLEDLFSDVSREADVLLLAGDLTDHGRIEEAEALESALTHVDVPVLAVLGNHDHESGCVPELTQVLEDAGVRVLDRAHTVIDGVGFAGVKGFGGGFGARIVRAFGEDALKQYVAESVAEATALRNELNALPEGPRVALLHYAPVDETLRGEPAEIQPFLGSSRLADALDEGQAVLAVHGHAHHGSPDGKTPRGVPVHNVAAPVLRSHRFLRPYRVFEV